MLAVKFEAVLLTVFLYGMLMGAGLFAAFILVLRP